MTAFINPYTFVPFPRIADRVGFKREPAGHARAGAGRLGGRIDVELWARSPLLLRGVRRGDVTEDGTGLFPRRVFTQTGADPVPFLPGSSLAGVVRSLHEAVAGGCLRVFDGGFRPGYRDPVGAREEDWTLAVVEQSTNGRPAVLRLCTSVVWVPARRLAEVLGGAARVETGSLVDITGSKERTFGRGRRQVSRQEADQDRWVKPGQGWVVLVSDSGARKQRHSFWCAVGKLGDARAAGVSDEAWEDFQRAVDGTDDVRRARAKGDLRPTQPVPTEVRYRYATGEELVGRRHEARPVVHQGQVLWVRAAGGAEKQVTGLALTHIWRHAGGHRAAERLPDELLLPCEKPDELCPTCRVFGAADTAGADTAQSRQHSYRGHLRFSDARPLGSVELRVEKLAPLGAPRPGAGQFYLEPSTRAPTWYDTPLREWGSAADDGQQPRRLRGRKQYWLTGRHRERPLFRVNDRSWTGEMASAAEAADAGSRFTFSVHFTGLSRAEIGGLLAALDPALALPGEPDRIGYAVGGGRPFGFGTCTATITALHVDDAASRYAAGPAPQLTITDAVAAFTGQADPGVKEVWPDLAAALTLDRAEPGSVWYPPEQPIPPGPLTTDDLKPGFEFWTQTRGYAERNGSYPLQPLPGPREADQTLPVLRREDRGKPRPRKGGQR